MLFHCTLVLACIPRILLLAAVLFWLMLHLHSQPFCAQIVLSVAEHHGNLVPWQMLAQRTGAVLLFAELTPTQEIDVEVRHALQGHITCRSFSLSSYPLTGCRRLV